MIANFFNNHYFILLLFLFFIGILAGFIDAIAGGGGLISLPALTYTGLPMVVALGTNKFGSTFGTGMATYKYYRGGLINISTVYRGLIMGFIGALLGAYTVNHISNSFMRVIVPFLLLFVFIFNIFNKKLGIEEGKKRMTEVMFFSVFGFIFGFYDAFFGPGVGNFWIISIVFFLGLTFLQASGYAKVLNLKSNIFSLCIFLFYGKVNYTFGIVMAIGQFFGGYLGAKSVILKGSKIVRPFFMAIVFINIIISFYELV